MELENKEWKQEKVKKMKAISLWTFAKSELIRKMDISWQNQSEEPACSSIKVALDLEHFFEHSKKPSKE